MTRSNRTPEFELVDKAIRRAAATWLARRHGGFADGEAVEFDEWLAAAPEHQAAWVEVESAWELVHAPIARGQSDDLRNGLAAHAQRQSRRRHRRWSAIGLAAAAAVAFAFFPHERVSRPGAAPVPTVALRPDTRTLPDGSTVEFNAGAEIAVEFTAEKRSVRLVRGEAHFVVTKDANRPFVVTAGTVDVQAVGTAFNVRFDPQQIDVLVTEGRVAVQRVSSPPEINRAPEPGAEPIYLGAGGRVALPADRQLRESAKVVPLSPGEVARALAWRGKRIEFTDTPLVEAVAVFNRQNQVRITVVNRADGARCINGVFWADDPAGFARLLGTSLGLTVEREGDEIVLRSR